MDMHTRGCHVELEVSAGQDGHDLNHSSRPAQVHGQGEQGFSEMARGSPLTVSSHVQCSVSCLRLGCRMMCLIKAAW